MEILINGRTPKSILTVWNSFGEWEVITTYYIAYGVFQCLQAIKLTEKLKPQWYIYL